LRGLVAPGAIQLLEEKNPMYVINHLDTHKYVARPGLRHSYTSNVIEVRIFKTRAAAQSECCSNESVEELQPSG
jgi:hypothetical protein